MYNFSKEERQILRSAGDNPHGHNLIDLLNKISATISDVENIGKDDDKDAQVEGRKLAKALFKEMIRIMEGQPETKKSSKPSEEGDYE